MTSSILNGQWIPFLANAVIQSLVLLAVAAVALACTRRVSAARRHLMASATLAALLLIQLMAIMIPSQRSVVRDSGRASTLQDRPSAPESSPSHRISQLTPGAHEPSPATQPNVPSRDRA